MVPVLRILYHPRHPGPPVTLPIRTHCGDQSFRPRAYHKPASKFYFVISKQPQSKVYSEVLIAGDLSGEEVSWAGSWGSYLITDPYTAEYVYGNDTVNTVYFAQPSPSQFVTGGSGAGTFNPAPVMGVKDPLNNTPADGQEHTEERNRRSFTVRTVRRLQGV